MYFVRIEDENGDGPWKSSHIDYIDLPTGKGDMAQRSHYSNAKHPKKYPNPHWDDTYGDRGCFRSAAKSVKQLLHWFPKSVLKQFEELGSKLVVYKIPDKDEFHIGKRRLILKEDVLKIGKKQIGYDERFAKKVKVYNPTRYKFAEKFIEKNA